MKTLFFVALVVAVSATVEAGSINVLAGYVQPSGDSDVYTQNQQETTFEVGDLNDFGGTVGYDHFLGNYVNLGASISFYESETNVQDIDFVFDDGLPVRRNIRLQLVPVEFNLRFLPAGREGAFIPYVGGGVGLYSYEYEELGDFIINRITDPTVITGSAFSDGTEPGFHVEGGFYIPVGRSIAVMAEAKYWKAEADLDERGFDPAFEPLDLSGTMISAGVSFWF